MNPFDLWNQYGSAIFNIGLAWVALVAGLALAKRYRDRPLPPWLIRLTWATGFVILLMLLTGAPKLWTPPGKEVASSSPLPVLPSGMPPATPRPTLPPVAPPTTQAEPPATPEGAPPEPEARPTPRPSATPEPRLTRPTATPAPPRGERRAEGLPPVREAPPPTWTEPRPPQSLEPAPTPRPVPTIPPRPPGPTIEAPFTERGQDRDEEMLSHAKLLLDWYTDDKEGSINLPQVHSYRFREPKRYAARPPDPVAGTYVGSAATGDPISLSISGRGELTAFQGKLKVKTHTRTLPVVPAIPQVDTPRFRDGLLAVYLPNTHEPKSTPGHVLLILRGNDARGIIGYLFLRADRGEQLALVEVRAEWRGR